MIGGIGLDIVLLSRMKYMLEHSGVAFRNKVFTASEQKRAENHKNPIACLSMTFAAKEAIFKAFALSWDTGVKMTEMEITKGKNGEPIPVLSGRFMEIAESRGISQVHLSLSYDGEYAIGSAIIN